MQLNSAPLLLLFAFALAAPLRAAENCRDAPPPGCIDSIFCAVTPVLCNGLRTGEFRVVYIEGGTAPFYYSLDGVNFSTNPLFDRLWAGLYRLTVRDSVGCLFEKTVFVPEAPELKVKLFANKTTVKPNEPFFVLAEVSPPGNEALEISWRPPNLFARQDTLAQKVQLADNESIAIEIKSPAGCVARDHIDIEVEKAAVFVPNVFEPGSQLNGFFTVYAGEGVAVVRSLRVYDRWNRTLFEALDFPPNDPFRGWDGKASGKKSSPGVYNWSAEVEYLSGKREVFAGDVTLLRDAD